MMKWLDIKLEEIKNDDKIIWRASGMHHCMFGLKITHILISINKYHKEITLMELIARTAQNGSITHNKI